MKKFVCIAFILLLLMPVILVSQDNSKLPPGESPPPDAFSRIKNAGDAEKYEDAAYIVVMDSLINKVNKLGISYIESYMLYKTLTDEGCQELAVLTRGYEPLSNKVEFKEINIIRGDKRIPVPLNGVLDCPAPQSGIYWGDRVLMVQLPRLQVNDGVEVRTYKKGYSYALLDSAGISPEDKKYIPPMQGEYFDIVLFGGTVPIVEKKYVIKLPADKRLHSQIYNGPMYSATTYDKDTTTYSWWIKNVPAIKQERYMPDNPDIYTKVVMATVESWEAKSEWFFQTNKGQFEVTPEIKAKVDEIFEKAGVTNGTEEQKAFELVHWVAQNIRYSGQTMGEGEGFTLHPGEMIFEQRSGVCKDIAGMLITMMRAAGMDSYGAMTMAGSRIEDLPADQFNHCVVALKKKDGSFVMYDPTWVPYNKTIWSLFEAEQDYLIGTPKGNSINRIPYSPPEESPMNMSNDASISTDGTLEGTLHLSADGAMDSYMRGLLVWYPLSETKNAIARLFEQINNSIEIVSIQHGDPLDFHENMWWEIKYKIPGYALPVDNGLEFKSPLLQLAINNRLFFRGAGYDWPEKRDADVFLYCTEFLNGTETISLPGGLKVTNSKNSDKVDETYAYFYTTADMNGKDFIIKEDAKIKRRQIPPDGYPGFYKMIKAAKDYSETVFRAEKGGAK